GGGRVALRDEGPVDEDVLDEAQLPRTRDAQGEADRAGSLDDVGVLDERARGGIVDVVDAGADDVRIRAALVRPVGGGTAVPVQVIVGEVEDRGGVGAHRELPVQLEAGQLDRQDIEV